MHGLDHVYKEWVQMWVGQNHALSMATMTTSVSKPGWPPCRFSLWRILKVVEDRGWLRLVPLSCVPHAIEW